MWDSQDSDTKIVIRKWYVLAIGWTILLAAPLLLSIMVFKIASGEAGAGSVVLISIIPILAAGGIWMAGGTTTVRLNYYSDSMTISRGYIPIFFWWQRTKSISRETARSVRVTSKEWVDSTEYRVEIEMRPGKKLFLFRDSGPADANFLEKIIRQWCGLESETSDRGSRSSDGCSPFMAPVPDGDRNDRPGKSAH